MEDIVAAKRALRRNMKERLKTITPLAREGAAQKVIALFQELLTAHRPQGTILAYWSMPDEFPTQALVRALSKEYPVLLPVVRGVELELHRYTGDEEMKAMPPYGILEPQDQTVVCPASVAVAIIPGLAFDADGGRMGRGKGYYDRLLPQLTQARLIGLGYGCQVVAEVPRESHDVLLDALLTEQGWLRGGAGC